MSAAAVTAVPAQFLPGAYETTCHRCGQRVWSVVAKSISSVSGTPLIRRSRAGLRPPPRRSVNDDGQPHLVKDEDGNIVGCRP